MTKRLRHEIVVLSTACAAIVLFARFAQAQEVTEKRPNIAALPASELSVAVDPATGATVLRFAATSWNNGLGPLELIGGEVGPGGQNVYQRVHLSNGGFYDTLAGTFEYHPEHNHFHFEGYALYTLKYVTAPGGSQRQSQKTSFCLLDTSPVNLTLPGAPQQAVYTTCNPVLQGVSVGWGDRYGPLLPGQSLDLTGSADGDYELTIAYDPAGRLLENNETDNTSCVRLRIDVTNRTVQTLGSCGTPSTVNVASISPNTAYQNSVVDVTITGSGFVPGMAVGFENGSGPAPLISNVVVVNSTTIRATVTIKAGGPRRERLWDVRVSSAVLQRGFRVLP